MKIFRDNVCYVNIKDLVGYNLPDDLNFDKSNYEENDYVMFTEQKDIEYVKNREDIIDYDYVSSLTDDELDKKIKRIEHDLEPYYKEIKDASSTDRIFLFKNGEFRQEFFKLDKIYYDLIHYRNNREYEDDKVLLLLSDNVIKKTR